MKALVFNVVVRMAKERIFNALHISKLITFHVLQRCLSDFDGEFHFSCLSLFNGLFNGCKSTFVDEHLYSDITRYLVQDIYILILQDI